jgi:lipoate-protein ligase A
LLILIPARFIDTGVLAPALFHATYAGIAQAMARDAAPVVMWGGSTPHVSLGQSQHRDAELARKLDVPVVTRPLGGGAVWIDESQYCFVLIAPRTLAPVRPADWYAWGLAPALQTFRHFGLQVVRREQDLWLDGRKIAGSGAASIGRAAVLASSFLLRFPAACFARCIASPSPAFRRWLRNGLKQAMTDWQSHQPPPDREALRAAFRAALTATLHWQFTDSAPSAAEQAAREEALDELNEPQQHNGARMVADGIKLNAATFLYQRRAAGGSELRLEREGAVIRKIRQR